MGRQAHHAVSDQCGPTIQTAPAWQASMSYDATRVPGTHLRQWCMHLTRVPLDARAAPFRYPRTNGDRVKTPEAIEICEAWFAYIERQRQRSIEFQKLATMARNGQQEEAQRRMRQIDRTPTVYDVGRLEPAVRHLVKLAAKRETIDDAVAGIAQRDARIAELEHHIQEHQSRDGLQQMRIEALEKLIEHAIELLAEGSAAAAKDVLGRYAD